MDKLFVDTNIVLDLLQKRKDFFEEAQELFTLADKKKVKLYISSLTIANTHYLLSRHYNSNDARKILAKFRLLVEVLSLDHKIIDLALTSDLRDFEDAIQYHTALENNMDLIITRNKKDFKKQSIPILTAKEYINRK
ncbi:PIN domain-containing protein [Agriterribacter sp.]|uniref:type II toxin-antitoxin system VapC family toxin n=1 Tax=Agriterribacter sp. TaxID=2821509 RepID=UPI002C2FC1D9|nr:PIN domain-containing protein [Agriterribacter sp.]HRP57715.1 PIN domain-containing protein [Agriterribacter sp.]